MILVATEIKNQNILKYKCWVGSVRLKHISSGLKNKRSSFETASILADLRYSAEKYNRRM